MKKPLTYGKICMKMAILFLLIWMMGVEGVALGEQVIALPDQSYTLTIGATAAVQRQPGTEIRSFDMDQHHIVWTTMVGEISGDKTGSTTLYLEEYDTERDILYKTRVHVTVKKRNTQLVWAWDQSQNSPETKSWTQKYGNTFPVGKTFSIRHTATLNGAPQQVLYYSNQPSVASVDANGLVTMKSPGTACVSCKTAAGDPGYSTYFIVYDAGSTGVAVGGYEPSDPGSRANIYQKPDDSSKILTTIGNYESLEHFYLLSRGDAWCRVTFRGYTGYMKTDDLTFYGEEKGQKEPRKIQTPCDLYVQAFSLGTLELKEAPHFRGATLGQYPTNTRVYVTEADENWARVQVDGKWGYMNVLFLTAVKPDQVIEDPASLGQWRPMTVATGNDGMLYLRKEGSADAAVLGQYKNGTQVQASYTQYGDWLKVRVSGKEGFMMAKFLVASGQASPAPDQAAQAGSKTMVIETGNPNRLHLRKAAKTGSASLGLYANGTRVQVLSISGAWARVEVGGKAGYMMLKFLADIPAAQENAAVLPKDAEQADKTAPAQPTAALGQENAVGGQIMIIKTGNSGGLYLRSGQDTASKALGIYANGTQVQVLERAGAWARVQIDGKTGYMMLKFLAAPFDAGKDAASPASPSQEKQGAAQPDAGSQGASAPVQSSSQMGKIHHPRGSYVNLRRGPHTSYGVLKELPHGTEVEILSRGEYWTKICCRGVTGYVNSNYLK